MLVSGRSHSLRPALPIVGPRVWRCGTGSMGRVSCQQSTGARRGELLSKLAVLCFTVVASLAWAGTRHWTAAELQGIRTLQVHMMRRLGRRRPRGADTVPHYARRTSGGCRDDGSGSVLGPCDSYCLVAMGRALGTTESHGAMGIVCGGRRMERRMVAPRCPQPTLHRSGPSQIQVAQRTPDAGDAGGRRLLLRGMWGGAVANGHGEWFTVECVECSGRKEHRGRNACM